MIYKAKVFLKAGDGGNGSVSFYRSRTNSKGGPNGGDGGDGGNIIFQACKNEKSLHKYKLNPHISSKNGVNGSPGDKNGADADTKTCFVPVGTQVWAEEQLLADLDKEHDTFIGAKGGLGGKGNTFFKSATNQTPIEHEPGEKGEIATYKLILKTIADIGIIGLPNAGKSSLLAAVSNAKPKIANYPFTTITPQLGRALYKEHSITFVDIPGLIEGAHQNRGLGHEFLSHVERCKVLVHLIDGSGNIGEAYQTVRDELRQYSPELAAKPELMVINKLDLLDEQPEGYLIISALEKVNITELLEQCYQLLAKHLHYTSSEDDSID